MRTIPQPGDAFGRYDLGVRVGRGGMGVVYATTHRDLDQAVALKLMAPELSDQPAYRARFLREANILARLDSPHVVRVHDAGEQDGWLYIATELVPDGDLGARLDRTGPLPVPEALDVIAQVADGLAAAHASGVLHRDIKPSNVLLARSTSGGLRAVLCDVGIATAADAAHTRTDGVAGTLGYLAPERHRGADASVASDDYALGCLLRATLTGAPPYTGTDFEVATGHVQAPPPVSSPARSGPPAAPPTPARTTSRTTTCRPPAIPADTPTVVPPPPPPPPRPRRRTPWVAVAAGLVLAVAGGVLAVVADHGGDDLSPTVAAEVGGTDITFATLDRITDS